MGEFCAVPFLKAITLIKLVHVAQNEAFFNQRKKNPSLDHLFSFNAINVMQLFRVFCSTRIPEQVNSDFFLSARPSSLELHIPHLFGIREDGARLLGLKGNMRKRSNCKPKRHLLPTLGIHQSPTIYKKYVWLFVGPSC